MSKEPHLYSTLPSFIKSDFSPKLTKNFQELCTSLEEKKYSIFVKKAGEIYKQLHSPKASTTASTSEDKLESNEKKAISKDEKSIWGGELLYILQLFFINVTSTPGKIKALSSEQVIYLGDMLLNTIQLVYGKESYPWLQQNLKLSDQFLTLYPKDSEISEKRKSLLEKNTLAFLLKEYKKLPLKYSDLLLRVIHRLFVLNGESFEKRKQIFNQYYLAFKQDPIKISFYSLDDSFIEFNNEQDKYIADKQGNSVVYCMKPGSDKDILANLWDNYQIFSEPLAKLKSPEIDQLIGRLAITELETLEKKNESSRSYRGKEGIGVLLEKSFLPAFKQAGTRTLRSIYAKAIFLSYQLSQPAKLTQDWLTLWLLPVINEMWREINATENWDEHILQALHMLKYITIDQSTLNHIPQYHQQLEALITLNGASFNKILTCTRQAKLCVQYIKLQSSLRDFFKHTSTILVDDNKKLDNLLPKSVATFNVNSAANVVRVFEEFISPLNKNYNETSAVINNLTDTLLILRAVTSYLDPVIHKQETEKFMEIFKQSEKLISHQLSLLETSNRKILLPFLTKSVEVNAAKPIFQDIFKRLLEDCSEKKSEEIKKPTALPTIANKIEEKKPEEQKTSTPPTNIKKKKKKKKGLQAEEAKNPPTVQTSPTHVEPVVPSPVSKRNSNEITVTGLSNTNTNSTTSVLVQLKANSNKSPVQLLESATENKKYPPIKINPTGKKVKQKSPNAPKPQKTQTFPTPIEPVTPLPVSKQGSSEIIRKSNTNINSTTSVRVQPKANSNKSSAQPLEPATENKNPSPVKANLPEQKTQIPQVKGKPLGILSQVETKKELPKEAQLRQPPSATINNSNKPSNTRQSPAIIAPTNNLAPPTKTPPGKRDSAPANSSSSMSNHQLPPVRVPRCPPGFENHKPQGQYIAGNPQGLFSEPPAMGNSQEERKSILTLPLTAELSSRQVAGQNNLINNNPILGSTVIPPHLAGYTQGQEFQYYPNYPIVTQQQQARSFSMEQLINENNALKEEKAHLEGEIEYLEETVEDLQEELEQTSGVITHQVVTNNPLVQYVPYEISYVERVPVLYPLIVEKEVLTPYFPIVPPQPYSPDSQQGPLNYSQGNHSTLFQAREEEQKFTSQTTNVVTKNTKINTNTSSVSSNVCSR